MFFKSIPTSAVTPSPNLKFEAATYIIKCLKRGSSTSLDVRAPPYLERVFLLDNVYRCGHPAKLVDQASMTMCTCRATTMARTSGVLRRSYEAKDGITL